MKRLLQSCAIVTLAVALQGCGGGGSSKIETPAINPNDTADVGISPTDGKKKSKKPPASNIGQAEKAATAP